MNQCLVRCSLFPRGIEEGFVLDWDGSVTLGLSLLSWLELEEACG